MRGHLLTIALMAASCGVAYASNPPRCLEPSTSPLVVPVNARLRQILIDDACVRVYATNASTNEVYVFSLLDGTASAPIAVGSLPAGLDTSPDGKTMYVPIRAATICRSSI